MSSSPASLPHEAIVAAVDPIVQGAVTGSPHVPGVVAGLTDRDGTFYLGTAGSRVEGEDDPVHADTAFAIYSTTKAITATGVLQLVERGRLDLEAPAASYLPEVGELQVLDGFDADGAPILRAPRRQPTTHDLLVHTAGFGYDFFNEHYRRLTHEHGVPSVITATKAAFTTPLLFDPGTRWEYGANIDWAGFVLEAITGQRLGDYLREQVLEPAGLHETGFEPDAAIRARLATIHQRGDDGELTPLRELTPPVQPEVHAGGHGLVSTVGDYLRFIRVWLNDGATDEGTAILQPQTVRWAVENHLGELPITELPAAIPSLTNPAQFFPGQRTSWAYSFLRNEEQAPTGRPAGSLGWAGLPNLYYWIDRATGIGGYWATQIFPFADAASIGGYFEFETAVYRTIAEQQR